MAAKVLQAGISEPCILKNGALRYAFREEDLR